MRVEQYQLAESEGPTPSLIDWMTRLVDADRARRAAWYAAWADDWDHDWSYDDRGDGEEG